MLVYMMRRLIIAGLFLVAACDDDAGDPGRYVAVGEYATVGKASWCSYLTRCGFFPDEATCTSANISVPPQLVLPPETVAAVEAGHLLYNGNNAKTCLDAYANATCDKTDESGRAPTPECFELFRGAVDADGECFQDEECISGDCQIQVADQTCAMGKCVGNTPPPQFSFGQAGDPCSTGTCAAGLFCDNATFKCATLVPSGGPCVTNADCAYGLGCAGSPRTCKALPAVGQPCPDFECRDEGARCGTSGCVAVGLAGAPCQSSSECSSYYTCDFTTSMCKRGPITGEACTLGNARCFDASFCDSSTLMCVPYRGPGEICSTSLQCASGECDFNANECVSPTTCL
jgi:hypothetical protein